MLKPDNHPRSRSHSSQSRNRSRKSSRKGLSTSLQIDHLKAPSNNTRRRSRSRGSSFNSSIRSRNNSSSSINKKYRKKKGGPRSIASSRTVSSRGSIKSTPRRSKKTNEIDVSIQTHPRVVKVKEQIKKEEDLIKHYDNRVKELIRRKGALMIKIEELETSQDSEIIKEKKKLIVNEKEIESSEERINLVGDIVERIILVYVGVSKKMKEFDNKQDERIFLSNLESEQVTLRKQDPMEVLKKLSENLNDLLSWKQRYENELKNEKNRTKTSEERILDEVKLRMSELQGLTDRYRLDAHDATRAKNSALRSRKITIEESNRIMRKLQKDNERLMDTYKGERDTIKDLNRKLQARDKILRHREIQLMEITQLESEIREMKRKHSTDTFQIDNEKKELSKEVEDKLKHFNKLEAERIDLQKDLKQKNQVIKSLKKDCNRVKFEQLVSSIQNHSEKLDEIKKKMKKVKKLHEELEKKVKILKKNNINLVEEQKEVTRKFNMIKRKKEKRKNTFLRKKVKELFIETEQKSSHVSSYYKMRLNEKKKEYEKLRQRIHNMVLNHKRSFKISKNNSNLRKNYKKIDLKDLDTKEKRIRQLNKENRAFERRLKEFKNFKEMLLSKSKLKNDILNSM